MSSQLVITLQTEKNGEAVQLHNLSASGLLSFTSVLESLRKLAIAIAGDENVRFSIESGSARAIAITDDVVGQSMSDTIEQALDGEISDKEILEPIRIIHKEIIRNDLTYGITLKRAGITVSDFKDIFQSKTRIVLKTKKGATISSEVIQAKVIAVGGKNPNYHLVIEDESEIIVKCSENDAMNVNPFLYQKISVLVQKTSYKRENKKDIFTHEAVLKEPETQIFHHFFSIYNSRNLMYKLQMLYDVFEKIMALEVRKFEIVGILLRQFDKEDIDINELKTLLILSNGMKENTIIKGVYHTLEQRYKKTKLKLVNGATT